LAAGSKSRVGRLAAPPVGHRGSDGLNPYVELSNGAILALEDEQRLAVYKRSHRPTARWRAGGRTTDQATEHDRTTGHAGGV